MDQENITALEALGIAIRSEVDAQEIYKDLADLCNDDILKNRFMNMYNEERRHQLLLEKMYKELFPDVDLMLPESSLPKDTVYAKSRKKLDLKDVLNLAFEEEIKSRKFYLDFADTVNEPSGKRMFQYLADMEFKHSEMISTELEMLKKYPAYLNGQKPWEVESRLRDGKIKRKLE